MELDHDRRGTFSAWIPIIGGPSVRLPMRMFESLLERDLFDLLNDGGTYKTWKLIDAEEREPSG